MHVAMPPEPPTTSKPAASTAGAASIRRPAYATSTEPVTTRSPSGNRSPTDGYGRRWVAPGRRPPARKRSPHPPAQAAPERHFRSGTAHWDPARNRGREHAVPCCTPGEVGRVQRSIGYLVIPTSAGRSPHVVHVRSGRPSRSKRDCPRSGRGDERSGSTLRLCQPESHRDIMMS